MLNTEQTHSSIFEQYQKKTFVLYLTNGIFTVQNTCRRKVAMAAAMAVAMTVASSKAKFPRTRHLCILCLRKATQFLFYRIVVGGLKSKSLLQLYGNYSGVPGEYHESVMLTIPPHGPVHCMPIPVVAHQRNRYEVQIRDNIKHLQQINVGFEDFH